MELLLKSETTSSYWLVLLLVKVCNYIFLRVHFFLKTIRMLDNSSECGRNLPTCSDGEVENEKAGVIMEVDEARDDEEIICMEEMITVVMDRLGMGSWENEENWRNVSVNEFEGLFDHEEPSLMEIKEVFQVFDENKDGYIDAAELQRILSGLRMIREEEKEEYKLEECRRMICAFDDNGDGLIDFPEFVSFMEKLQ